MTDALSYPLGRFDITAPIADGMRASAIDTIARLPAHIGAALDHLTSAQIDTPYRPGGWTVRQLVHHVADSHMNAFIRLKLGLTENSPTIKPYDQNAWAMLADARLPIDVSLDLIDALHARWTAVWRSMEPSAFSRTLMHPELGALTLDRHLQLYAWHSRHHVAHITALRAREHW